MLWKAAAVLTVLAILAYLFLPRGSTSSVKNGVRGSLSAAISGLLHSARPDAFLVVQIRGTDDFLQFTAVPGSVQMDFPLVTERQRKLRTTVEEVCATLGLSRIVNKGTDGSEFLDYDLSGSPESITGIIRQVLDGVFDASADEHLVFHIERYSLDDA